MNIDPLAEKYYGINPFAYVANNPVKFIDPDGKRIVDPESALKASAIQASLELKLSVNNQKSRDIINSATNKKGVVKLSKSQKAELNKISSINHELNKSIGDINDMRNDNNNNYKYASSSSNNNNPEVKRTGNSEITIFSNDLGTDVHETRHGGQIARGEFDVDSNGQLLCGSFGASNEIDAYSAQLAAVGSITFMPKQNDNDPYTQTILQNGFYGSLTKTITNLSEINNNFLKSVSDITQNSNGTVSTVHVYPPTNTNFYAN